MLQVKSVIILKANPAIFKRSGGMKMGAWHCVERESFVEFGTSVGVRKNRRNIERQKKMLRE